MSDTLAVISVEQLNNAVSNAVSLLKATPPTTVTASQHMPSNVVLANSPDGSTGSSRRGTEGISSEELGLRQSHPSPVTTLPVTTPSTSTNRPQPIFLQGPFIKTSTGQIVQFFSPQNHLPSTATTSSTTSQPLHGVLSPQQGLGVQRRSVATAMKAGTPLKGFKIVTPVLQKVNAASTSTVTLATSPNQSLSATSLSVAGRSTSNREPSVLCSLLQEQPSVIIPRSQSIHQAESIPGPSVANPARSVPLNPGNPPVAGPSQSLISQNPLMFLASGVQQLFQPSSERTNTAFASRTETSAHQRSTNPAHFPGTISSHMTSTAETISISNPKKSTKRRQRKSTHTDRSSIPVRPVPQPSTKSTVNLNHDASSFDVHDALVQSSQASTDYQHDFVLMDPSVQYSAISSTTVTADTTDRSTCSTGSRSSPVGDALPTFSLTVSDLDHRDPSIGVSSLGSNITVDHMPAAATPLNTVAHSGIAHNMEPPATSPDGHLGGYTAVAAGDGAAARPGSACRSIMSPGPSPGNFTPVSHLDVIALLKNHSNATAGTVPHGTVDLLGSHSVSVPVPEKVAPPAAGLEDNPAAPEAINPLAVEHEIDKESQNAVAAVIELLLEPCPTDSAPHVGGSTVQQASQPTEPPTVHGGIVTAESMPFYCLDCNRSYENECKAHNTDYVCVSDSEMLPYAQLSLPPLLKLVKCNWGPTSKLSVVANEDIAKGTKFGPMVGLTTNNTDSTTVYSDLAHLWPVPRGGTVGCYLDCRDENSSNWMRFVKRAKTDMEWNVVVYQQGHQLYFITSKPIPDNTQLAYWYSGDYCTALDAPGSPEESFQCLTCCKQFPSMSRLTRHISQMHPVLEGRKHTCQCCFKSFGSSTKLNQHLMIHRKLKPYACPKCGKAFNDKSNLKKHQRIHNDEKNFPCTVCEQHFRQKAHLDAHMVMHTALKHFVCHYCAQKFSRSSELRTHLYRHTNEKYFTCADCGKIFYKRQNLQKHLQQLHLQQKNFLCPKCQKGFLTKYHMERHLARCKGPGKPSPVSIHPETGAELGLSIAKRRIQKKHREMQEKGVVPE